MTGINDLVTIQLPVTYNKYNNELIINIPKNCKIKFLNDINIDIDGQFNILSFNQMNLCSVNNNINIDSLNAAIYLNSEKAVQLKKIKIIDINNNLFNKRKNILSNINKCVMNILQLVK